VKKGSAHKVLIRDVEVYFPYKPYDVQIAYMESGIYPKIIIKE